LSNSRLPSDTPPGGVLICRCSPRPAEPRRRWRSAAPRLQRGILVISLPPPLPSDAPRR
jgi:hypothetical protein